MDKKRVAAYIWIKKGLLHMDKKRVAAYGTKRGLRKYQCALPRHGGDVASRTSPFLVASLYPALITCTHPLRLGAALL